MLRRQLETRFIPSQKDFVDAFGISSVIGFGSILPSGYLFAIILFSKLSISRETAQLFRMIALGVKLALLPHTRGQIFDDDAVSHPHGAALKPIEDEQLRSETATLHLLLVALEETALHQTHRLQVANQDLLS
jgi:hypothetical protein